MASAVIQLFCEDSGHERFMRALIDRLVRECGPSTRVDVGCARGGAGNALGQFRNFQSLLRRTTHRRRPDLLVVVVDANCVGWNERRIQANDAIDSKVFPRRVVGIPDPHVERWCFVDRNAFQRVVGVLPDSIPSKCGRDGYKRLLEDALTRAGVPVLTGPMEIAPDIVHEMDLRGVERDDQSLGHLVKELRANFRDLFQLLT